METDEISGDEGLEGGKMGDAGQRVQTSSNDMICSEDLMHSMGDCSQKYCSIE